MIFDILTLFPGVYPFNTRVPADDSAAIRQVLNRHPEVKLWESVITEEAAVASAGD